MGKQVIEHCLRLDATLLKTMVADLCTQSHITAVSVTEERLTVDVTRTPTGGFAVATRATVTRHGRPSIVTDSLWLTATRPTYGGARWWLVCPLCEQRMRVLWLPLTNGVGFGCRRCLELAYYSQRLSQQRLRARKMDVLKGKLGATGYDQAPVVPIPPRPKGMWGTTYARLVNKLQAVEAKYWQAEWEWIQRLKHPRAKVSPSRIHEPGIALV